MLTCTSAEDPPSSWDIIGRGYHIASSGLADSCVSLMRQWLALCTSGKDKHLRCEIPEEPLLPKRLVYIGDIDTPSRLYISEPGEKGRFAALSHCWGGKVAVRTLRSNLEDHILALPSPLPKTFADALAVARALGIKYVWIDSLCIVQDDLLDWEAEAAQMANVYANAHVTISADAAPNALAGFLDAPSRTVVKTVSVAVPDSDAVIHFRKRGFLAEELPFHSWGDPDTSDGRSKLSTRAWVFQERILSPRTIHFAENEMAWECRSLCDCECSTTSVRTLRKTSVIKHFVQPGPIATRTEPTSPQTSWRHNIVPAYTRLDLTVETDRLPAMAGLADAASRVRSPDDQYLCGLWRGTLRDDLLWQVTLRGGARALSEGYAPSWSWASVAGPVSYTAFFDREAPAPEPSISNVQPMSENALSLDMGLVDFSVVDVQFINGWPKVLTGRCRTVSVWTQHLPPGYNAEASVLDAPSPIKLSIVWDRELDPSAGLPRFRGDATECVFAVFGWRTPGNGPFGLLLEACPAEATDGGADRFRRVGFINGYRPERQLRTWDSSGWLRSEEEDMEAKVRADAARIARFDWESKVRHSGDTTVSIV